MADLDEAFGQHVEKEAPNEFLGRQEHGLTISGLEGHALLVDRHQPAVGDGHAVRVEAEIGKDLLWPAERLLGVDDPPLAVEGVLEELKDLRIS
jgi:hypothetical protein